MRRWSIRLESEFLAALCAARQTATNEAAAAALALQQVLTALPQPDERPPCRLTYRPWHEATLHCAIYKVLAREDCALVGDEPVHVLALPFTERYHPVSPLVAASTEGRTVFLFEDRPGSVLLLDSHLHWVLPVQGEFVVADDLVAEEEAVLETARALRRTRIAVRPRAAAQPTRPAAPQHAPVVRPASQGEGRDTDVPDRPSGGGWGGVRAWSPDLQAHFEQAHKQLLQDGAPERLAAILALRQVLLRPTPSDGEPAVREPNCRTAWLPFLRMGMIEALRWSGTAMHGDEPVEVAAARFAARFAVDDRYPYVCVERGELWPVLLFLGRNGRAYQISPRRGVHVPQDSYYGDDPSLTAAEQEVVRRALPSGFDFWQRREAGCWFSDAAR